jgi:hypothetical protein
MGVKITEAVHDDKASVDGILAEYGITSQKNLWHKCKNLCAKSWDELVKVQQAAIVSPAEARAACDMMGLTMEKLKEYLKKNEFNLKGKKDALVARVWQSLEREDVTIVLG